MERFVSDAAHELRTPLTVIRGANRNRTPFAPEPRTTTETRFKSRSPKPSVCHGFVEKACFSQRRPL